MITTVTLNPMLDKTVTVDALRRGGVMRALRVDAVVGGKGVNVSRQLQALGHETVATGFAGGEVGTLMERSLDEENIRHEFVRVQGMSREGVTYRESDGTVTAVFEPPHEVTAGEVEQLLITCRALAGKSSWVVCSGSSPNPAADGAFQEIIADCRARGIPVALDSYGNALARGCQAVPNLMKPNKEEFTQTFGTSLRTEREMAAAAQAMIARGVQYCLITDGPRPAVAATREETWAVHPPVVGVVNATGSGDSMLAGFLYGVGQGWPFAECLAFGVAAGAANARVWQVAASTRDEIDELLPRVTIRKIADD